MSDSMYLGAILLVTMLGVVITRFLPFILFPTSEKTPPIVKYLGELLPPCTFGLLVVYSFKDVTFWPIGSGIKEILAIIFVCLIHFRYKNTILTIATSTIFYVCLVNLL